MKPHHKLQVISIRSTNERSGADPGFFVGGGRTRKMGAIWSPWLPYHAYVSLNGNSASLGPTLVDKEFFHKISMFWPKKWGLFLQPWPQAPAPGSAPEGGTSGRRSATSESTIEFFREFPHLKTHVKHVTHVHSQLSAPKLYLKMVNKLN